MDDEKIVDYKSTKNRVPTGKGGAQKKRSKKQTKKKNIAVKKALPKQDLAKILIETLDPSLVDNIETEIGE